LRKEEGINWFEVTKEEEVYPKIEILVKQFLTEKGREDGRFS